MYLLRVSCEVRPLLGQHPVQLRLGNGGQQGLAKLEVKHILQQMVKLIDQLSVVVICEAGGRLYCVCCGLEDCPGALIGQQVVQEHVQAGGF